MKRERSQIEFRLKVLTIASELGVTRCSEIYNLDPKTIRNWRKRFDSEGKKGLENRSKKGVKQVKTMPKSIYESIEKIVAQNPKISGREIKERLNISYSIKTILKKVKEIKEIKESGNNRLEQQVVRSPLPQNDFIFTTYALGSPSNSQIINTILLLIHRSTGIIFSSFSKERSDSNIAIFIDYALNQFSSMGVDITLKNFIISPIYTKGGGAVGNVFKNHKVSPIVEKDKVSLKSFKNIDKINQFIDNINLLGNSSIEDIVTTTHRDQIIHNCDLLEIFFDNNKYSNYLPHLKRLSFHFVPIITDRFFVDLRVIVDNRNYWKDRLGRNRDEILKTSKELHLYADRSLNSGENREALYLYRIVEFSWDQLGVKDLRVLSILKQCYALWNLERGDEGWELLQRAYFEAKKIKTPETLIKCYNFLSMHYYRSKNLDKAFLYNRKELELAKKIGDEKTVIRTTINLGLSLQLKGRFTEAIKLYKNLIKQSTNSYIITIGYINLSLLYLTLEKPNQSLTTSFLALEYCNDNNYHNNDYLIYSIQGRSYLELGQLLESKVSFHKVSEITHSKGLIKEYFEAQNYLGLLAIEIGEYRKGLEIIERIKEGAKEIEIDSLLPFLYLNQSKIYFRLAKKQIFLDTVTKSIELAKQYNDHHTLNKALLLKAVFYRESGNYNEGIKIYKEIRDREVVGGRVREICDRSSAYLYLLDSIKNRECKVDLVIENVKKFLFQYQVKRGKRNSVEFNFRLWRVVKVSKESGIFGKLEIEINKLYPELLFDEEILRQRSLRGYKKLYNKTQRVKYKIRFETLKKREGL